MNKYLDSLFLLLPYREPLSHSLRLKLNAVRSPATKQFDVSAEIRVQAVIIRRRKHGQNLRCHIRDSSLCMRASVHLLPWNCACIRIPPVCTGEIVPADRNRFLPADVSIRRHRKSCRPHADHLESNRCPNEGHSRASQESYNNNNNNNVNSLGINSFFFYLFPLSCIICVLGSQDGNVLQ